MYQTDPSTDFGIEGWSIPLPGTNWCGPGHPKKGKNPPALHPVDSVCRTHDKCYDRRGYLDCRCDRELLRSMPQAIARTRSGKGKAAGLTAIAAFSHTPCFCRKKVCVPVPSCRMVRRCKRIGIGKFSKKICTKVPQCRTIRRCKRIPVPGAGGRGIC